MKGGKARPSRSIKQIVTFLKVTIWLQHGEKTFSPCCGGKARPSRSIKQIVTFLKVTIWLQHDEKTFSPCCGAAPKQLFGAAPFGDLFGFPIAHDEACNLGAGGVG